MRVRGHRITLGRFARDELHCGEESHPTLAAILGNIQTQDVHQPCVKRCCWTYYESMADVDEGAVVDALQAMSFID